MTNLQTTSATPKKATDSKKINFIAFLNAINDNLLKKKAKRATVREYGDDRIMLTRHVKKVFDHFTNISTISCFDFHIPSNIVWLLTLFNRFSEVFFLYVGVLS